MPRKRPAIEWCKATSKLPAVQQLSQVANHTDLDMCGPTCIAAITGLPLRDVYLTIFRSRGYDPDRPQRVHGMSISEVVGTLGMLGYRADVFDVLPAAGKRITVRRFFIDRGDDQAACIAVTRTHFIAMDWGVLVDNHSNGLYCTIDDAAFKNASVINYIEVRKL